MSRTPSRIDRLRAEHKAGANIAGKLPARPNKPRARPAATDQIGAGTEAIRLVPLNLLSISTHNVRTANAEEDIGSLADSIHNLGLIANLAAHPELGEGYGVYAGGRRLRALWHNRDLGRIPFDWPVPIRLGTADEAREVSLAENVQRLPMNPVDEFEAYSRLVADHADETDPAAFVAKRFHKTRIYVEQRLRLAALAPEILDALRDGEIRLESANAYAGFDDQHLQAVVYRAEEFRTFGRHEPRNIRDAMRLRTYPATIRQARYVGLDAYERAGGRTDRDLFMGQEEGDRLLDPSILDRLAREKAEAELPASIARDGFGKGELVDGFAELHAVAMPRPPKGFTLGAVVPTNAAARLHALLSPGERQTCAGIYALDVGDDGLVCVGWFAPIAPPAPAPNLPPKDPPADLRSSLPPEKQKRMDAAIGIIDGTTAATRADKERADRVRRLAGHIAVARAIGDVLDGKAFMPADVLWVPTIAQVEGDPDTLLVAVQIRLPRAEFEAAMPDAETRLADEETVR
jgi:ParB family chromosome partitioning protein